MTDISVSVYKDLLARFNSIGFIDVLKPQHIAPINKAIEEVLLGYKLVPEKSDILYFNKETEASGKAYLHRDYKSCSKWYSEKKVIDCEKVFEIGFAKDGDFDFKLSASSEYNPGDLIIKPDYFSYGTGYYGEWDFCLEHLIMTNYPLVWKRSLFLIKSYPKRVYIRIDNFNKTCKITIPLLLEDK